MSYDAHRFVLAVPMHFVAIVVCVPMLAVGAMFALRLRWTWRLLALLPVLLGLDLLTYSSTLTLDRDAGTATIREFMFFHWLTRTYRLDEVDRVYVSGGSTTSQLRVQFLGGTVRSISLMDQSGGKERVAYLANAFLGTAARSGN